MHCVLCKFTGKQSLVRIAQQLFRIGLITSKSPGTGSTFMPQGVSPLAIHTDRNHPLRNPTDRSCSLKTRQNSQQCATYRAFRKRLVHPPMRSAEKPSCANRYLCNGSSNCRCGWMDNNCAAKERRPSHMNTCSIPISHFNASAIPDCSNSLHSLFSIENSLITIAKIRETISVAPLHAELSLQVTCQDVMELLC
jgi:hypothetical protein